MTAPRLPITLAPVTDPGSPWLEAIAALYCAAFPASERKPAAFLAEAVQRPDYALLAAHDHAGAVAGMALVYRSAAHPFALLEYMAVDADRRGGGIGATLFESVAAAAGRPLLLEVESVRAGEAGADLRARRIHFYRRHGCREIAGLDYRMPPQTIAPPPPMVLLERGWGADAIPGATLRAWLADIYTHVYARPQDDPALARMQQALGASVPLA